MSKEKEAMRRFLEEQFEQLLEGSLLMLKDKGATAATLEHEEAIMRADFKQRLAELRHVQVAH